MNPSALVLTALILANRSSPARTNELRGPCGFGGGAAFVDPVRVGRPARLSLYVEAVFPRSTPAELILHLPSGVEHVSGPTTFRGHVGDDWIPQVRVNRRGRFQILFTITYAVSSTEHYEGDFVLPFEVRSDTTIVEYSRLVRSETVRAGQRLRCGPDYLVPIDAPETFTQMDLTRHGVRARGPQRLDVACESCTEATDSLLMIVFVAADGRVTNTFPRHPWDIEDEKTLSSVRRAVHDATFQPAVYQGRRVPDWTYLDVFLRPRR